MLDYATIVKTSRPLEGSMRMSKELVDELTEQMKQILAQSETVYAIAVVIDADGQQFIIETPEDTQPFRYPRYDDIHGKVH